MCPFGIVLSSIWRNSFPIFVFTLLSNGGTRMQHPCRRGSPRTGVRTRSTTHTPPHNPPSTWLYYSNISRSRSLWRWNGSDNHGKYLLAHRLVYAFCNYFSRFALTPSNLAEMEYILIKIWRACAFFFFTSIINSFSATTKCAHFLATNWIEICYIFWKDFLYLGPPC